MLANNKLILAAFFSFFLSFFVIADSEKPEKSISNEISEDEMKAFEIIGWLNERVMKAMIVSGKKIRECEKQTLSNPTPILSKQDIKSNKIEREQIFLAIAYFNFKNEAKCHGDFQMRLSYEMATLALIKEHYNYPDAKLMEKANKSLMFPSVDEIDREVQYSKLPDNLKRLFKKTFGGKPFDMIKALEVNDPSP